jgi:bifunctional DNA-binding transcriptional regulator/antitoxin component of YhaV-PrlF toxin-antitoxin module
MSNSMSVRVASNGRLVLPKAIRKALGVENAGVVVMSVVDDEVRLTSVAKNIAAAQAYYKAHVLRDATTDDFLEDRRKEALAERTFDKAD